MLVLKMNDYEDMFIEFAGKRLMIRRHPKDKKRLMFDGPRDFLISRQRREEHFSPDTESEEPKNA